MKVNMAMVSIVQLLLGSKAQLRSKVLVSSKHGIG
jgi:hypothetical protein